MAKIPETPDSMDNGFRECDICFENVGQKKVLPCGHDLCIPCLERIFHQIFPETPTSSQISIPCPKCRQETMISTTSGIQTLPNRFFGTLKCGFCQFQKPTDEMWWCPVCVNVLCSKCDVKEHRSFSHTVFEWNSLQGVKDCCALLRGNRILERDLKDFFGKVTAEILASLNSNSEKTEIAALLATAYGILDPSTPERNQFLTHDSDKTHETLTIVRQAFSLADIEIPTDLLVPSTGERTVQNIISTVSPKSVADSLLSGAISIGTGMENGTTTTTGSSRPPLVQTVTSEPPPLVRRPLRPSAPQASGPEEENPLENPLYPTMPPPFEQITGMTLESSFPLQRQPSEFSAFRSDSIGKFFAIFSRNEVTVFRRSPSGNDLQFVDNRIIRSGIIDAFVADSQQLYVLSYSGASGVSLFSYNILEHSCCQFFNDILELKSESETRICSVSKGTTVYVAQKDNTRRARTTVVYKYTTGGKMGAFGWLQKMLLYPVAKIPDNSNLGNLVAMSVTRTIGEHYTDVIAVGFQYGVVVLQVSDYRLLMKQEEFPGGGECLSFSQLEFNSLHLWVKKSSTLVSKEIAFNRQMVQGQGNRERMNKMIWSWTGANQPRGVTFDPDGFQNSVIFGKDNNVGVGYLARLNLHGRCVDVYRVG